MDLSWYYISGILCLAGIYMLPVLGLALLTGFTGLFSFGHAGFMAIGGYTTAFMMIRLGIPFIPSLLLGGVMAAFIALIIGRLTLKLKGDYFCGARGWPGIPLETNLLTVVIFDILAVIILRNIVNSRHGRNMIAVREEELASQVIGINVFKYKMMSFCISAFYGGVGGGLLATYLGFLQPKIFGMNTSTELTIIVIFGGLGSITGGVIGSIILKALPELLRSFSDWRLVVYGLVVVFIMIARPQGLVGGKEFSVKGIYHYFKNLFDRDPGGGGSGSSSSRKNKIDGKPTKEGGI
jgi:branched-chain amino acid transport system permease protein